LPELVKKHGSFDKFLANEKVLSYVIPNEDRVNYTTGIVMRSEYCVKNPVRSDLPGTGSFHSNGSNLGVTIKLPDYMTTPLHLHRTAFGAVRVSNYRTPH